MRPTKRKLTIEKKFGVNITHVLEGEGFSEFSYMSGKNIYPGKNILFVLY
jgi:hypothetical protein